MSFALAVSLLAAAEPDEFTQRVSAYADLRAKAAKDLPALPKASTPEKIQEHRARLFEKLRTLRANAKPGDVLTPAVYEIVAAVRKETVGAQGEPARSTVLGEGNPAQEGVSVPLRINAPYPAEAPLSSVPADMLARLPGLPDGLQYRFVGRSLILYDSDADMIVDYLSEVVP